MADGKHLVVYYSRTGNTRKVAQAVAKLLGADVEEIVDKKERSGAVGFLVGAKDARLKRLTDIESPSRDPSQYGTVLIGTPVWAWTMSPAVRTYLARMKERLPRVAFFLTTGGTGIERTFKAMSRVSGKQPVATLGIKERELRKEDWQRRASEFAAAVQA